MMDEYSSGSSLLTWIRTSGIDVAADFMSLMCNSSPMMKTHYSQISLYDLEAFSSRTWRVEFIRTS